ncbi:gamma-glutamylcyclotransferase [Paeniglutamicibacter sp. NPDC012692]|uniref:gamma-glutamylcyclotransferase n=1 Tax=Paeniglutamicibacter sp. NPDC012692 TaxID=3364388 RepID=UPI0036B416A3
MSPFAVTPPPLNPGIVSYGRWTKKDKVPMRSTNSSSASVVATIPTSGKKVKVSQVKGAWSRVTYGSKTGRVVAANDLTTENTRSFLVYGTLRYKKPNWSRVSNAEARQSTKIKGHALYNVKFGKQTYGATTANSSKTVVADQLSFKASDWTSTLARVDALEFNLKVRSGSTLVRFYQRNKATASDGTKSWSYPVSTAAVAKAHLTKHGTAIKSGDLYA